MDNESLNWFRFAKCLADAGNKVLGRYLYFHASTCSLSRYHDVWQAKVKYHCQSDDLKVLWTSLNQHSLALDATSQQIVQLLLSNWKDSIVVPTIEIRKQLSALERWEMDLQVTISKNATQQNTLSKLSSEIQKLVTQHSLFLTAVRTWTKDFIHLCHMNQLDLLHWIEQHNERTSSLLSTFLQQLDIIYIRQRSEDLKNSLKACQQDEGNSSSQLKTNIQTSFISWKTKIDKLIDSWVTNIPNCVNQKILHNLLTDMRNDLPGVHNTCQVNVNDICSTWHKELQKNLAELNHQLQQVGESTGDLHNLAMKWHEKLKAFPSVTDRQIKEFFVSKETDLRSLKKHLILTEPQWSLIFPSQGAIKLEAFDITLSSTLLRNIFSVYPPELGWSGKILDLDHSMGADLMRLRMYRNDYVGHIPHLALPNSDFEKIWGILETILHRLSMPMGNEFLQEIQQKITEVRTCSFDVHAEMKLQLDILNWYKSDSGHMKEEIEGFRQVLEGMLIPQLQETSENIQKSVTGNLIPRLQGLEEKCENIQKCMTEETIQHSERIERRVTARIEEYMSNQRVNRTRQNQRIDLTKGKLRRHRDNHKDVHVRTRAYEHARTILLTHRHLVLQGNPGDGKTHTALSLISDLMEMYQEMQPVMVNKPNEWEELVDMKQPLIVFMDDVLGKYGVSETDLIEWEQLSELIHPNTGDSSVFIIVCLRNQIALKSRSCHRNEAFSWMFDSNMINISDEKYCLTKQEKTEMLMKYATKHLKETKGFVVDKVVNIKNVIGFPQNCRIWSCRQNLALEDVYENNMFLFEEIQDLAMKSQQDYLFLVLLMLSGGSLSLGNNTEELKSKIKKISELFGVRKELNISQCKDISHALSNTYLEYNNETKTFRFQHDSIESAVFCSFGRDYPEITLELCSLQVLTKMCCVTNEGNISNDSFLNFKIIIEDNAYFKVIIERFSKGLESRNSELFKRIAEALVWQSTQFSDYCLRTLTSSVEVLKFLSLKDFDEKSLLVYFIYADNTTVVKQVVEKISQFYIRDHDLVSRQILLATVNACLADKADIVKYLVGFQSRVDDFVMFAAATTGNVSIMDKLLLDGGNLNALISVKLSKGVKYTITNCASYPNNASCDHMNLLHIACVYGRTNMVMYLENKCSELSKARTKEGWNALHIAARNKNLAIVNYLIKECPQLVQETHTDMLTPLHTAAQGGDVQVIQALIKAGSDIMARTNMGNNILHLAALCNNLSAMEYLIKTYPELKHDITNNGWTILHSCSDGGGISAMELLVKEGFDIKARTKYGRNALHIAAGNKNLAIVNFLIKECPQLVQETNTDMLTPLHTAAQGGDVQVIQALVKAGSDIMARTNIGNNILHLAALCNNLSAMEYLIKTYPELKHDINNDGWTILHSCSEGGGISAMELLVKEGFDIKARTKQGMSALVIAVVNTNFAIVNYLIKKCPQLFQEMYQEALATQAVISIEDFIKEGLRVLFNICDTNVIHHIDLD